MILIMIIIIIIIHKVNIDTHYTCSHSTVDHSVSILGHTSTVYSYIQKGVPFGHQVIRPFVNSNK